MHHLRFLLEDHSFTACVNCWHLLCPIWPSRGLLASQRHYLEAISEVMTDIQHVAGTANPVTCRLQMYLLKFCVLIWSLLWPGVFLTFASLQLSMRVVTTAWGNNWVTPGCGWSIFQQETGNYHGPLWLFGKGERTFGICLSPRWSEGVLVPWSFLGAFVHALSLCYVVSASKNWKSCFCFPESFFIL